MIRISRAAATLGGLQTGRPSLVFLVTVAAGCAAAAVPATPPPIAAATVTVTATATATPTPTPTAAPTPPSPFLGPPRPKTRMGDTVGGAGCLTPHPTPCSVLIGVPEGWTTENVYSAYDVAYPKGAFQVGHPSVMGYYHVASGTAASGTDLEPASLKTLEVTMYLVDVRWDAPVEVAVGEQGLHGRMALGHGTSAFKSEGERDAFAVVVDVPARKSVFLLGTWLASKPEDAELLRDMVRVLAPCEFKPNQGCVRVP